MKKLLALIISAAMLVTVFSGCGGSNGGGNKKGGKVYYLNFKPEQDGDWQRLAKEYTEETGVDVKILTAAEGTYEQTLASEIEKTDAPTLFQISGTLALDTWDDYCLDLSDSDLYKELTSDDFALYSGDKVKGIAYVYEGYGIIANKKLLQAAGYDIEDITSFEKLKECAEDITKRKDELGFSAFTSSGLDSSSSWRFSGHLANMPLYYEFTDRKVTAQPENVEGKYLSQFKNIWDLYINNATCKPTEISTKTGDDALAEFTTSKAAFFQNGTWVYEDIKTMGDENLGYLPIYIGVKDENQGLCCGTENYWAVNANSPEEDRKATLDFLKWVVTSETGTTTLAKDMGFVSPFKSAKKTENVLCNIMNNYVSEGKYTVTWDFNYTPNVDDFRAELVSALNAYSAGTGSWDAVEKVFTENWAKHYKSSHQ